MKTRRIITRSVERRVYVECLMETLTVINRILVYRGDIKIMRREWLCVELRKGDGAGCSIITTGAPGVIEGG